MSKRTLFHHSNQVRDRQKALLLVVQDERGSTIAE